MSKTQSTARMVVRIILLTTRVFLLPFRLLYWALTLLSQVLGYIWDRISRLLKFSITFKTTSVYILVFAAILFMLNIIVTGAFGTYLFFEASHSLGRHADFILGDLNRPVISESQFRDFADKEGIEITLFNQQGNIVLATNPATMLATRLVSGRPSFTAAPGSQPDIWIDGFQFLNYGLKTGQSGAAYYLQLTQPILREKQYLALLVVILAAFSTLSLLAAVIIGSLTSKKMLRPIAAMTRTARSISANALSTRLDVVGSHDELKDLAETFNQMLDRIERSYEQQNRFVSDASHELRTPIAVIQGYANLLKRWGRDDQEILTEAINAMVNESAHMKELVEKLLFLARTEQETQMIEKEDFLLSELVNEVVQETRLIAPHHALQCGPPNEAGVIRADRRLIKQALRIFVDNSIKYTPAGGAVTLSSATSGSKVVIRINDNGVGIAKAEISRIFDRFYRCDESRSKTSGGTGLGLSIAKWIVEKHQGTINVESTLGSGTSITVILPTA